MAGPDSKPLAGRVALVTGGAGGLGAAICTEMAAAGAAVVVGYHRSGDRANALAAALPPAGSPHLALRVAVTEPDSVAACAAEVRARFAQCNILVNCAGTTRFVEHHDLDGLDDGLFDEILATNVRAPFAMIRALRPLMQSSEAPVVINISSIAAVTAMGSNVAYCASKAALDNMTRSLARALAPQIRVVSLSPGLVDTSFVKQLSQSWRDEQAGRTPLRRLAMPAEIGRAAVAIAGALTFTTGAIIPVDGGRPLG